jgi:cell division protein YceG involved in septum cleavage
MKEKNKKERIEEDREQWVAYNTYEVRNPRDFAIS